MEISNLMAIQRDDGLFNITFYIDDDFHQLFMTTEVFDRVIGHDTDNTFRLAEYIYTLFN